MAGSCCNKTLKFDGVSRRYKTILWIVIALNGTMFFVEMFGGIAANSVALQADALDFLGDTLTYGLTLLAIGHSLKWRASAAIVKGISLVLMGIWVFGYTVYRVFVLGIPNEMIMSSVALLAFTVNVICVLLLLGYREGDSNVRSVWLCSRNDAIGNLAVLAAAGIVYLTQSGWPDVIVALLMAGLFLHSATLILRQAKEELQLAREDSHDHTPTFTVTSETIFTPADSFCNATDKPPGNAKGSGSSSCCN